MYLEMKPHMPNIGWIYPGPYLWFMGFHVTRGKENLKRLFENLIGIGRLTMFSKIREENRVGVFTFNILHQSEGIHIMKDTKVHSTVV